jgi:hypothetical protein
MRRFVALLIVARVTVAMAFLSASLVAQTAAPGAAQASGSSVPRASDGKPDLTGVWQAGSTARGSWEEANSGTGLGGTGKNPSAPAVLSASDRPAAAEKAPYQPWAAQKVLESYKNRGVDDPSAQCLPPGIPRTSILGLYPTQIVQTPRLIVILYEQAHEHRIIPLNAKHPDDLVPAYMGDSVGHWEGDTLVVDVTGFNDKTWLVGTGTFHTDALHVTERYTRVDKDQINYDITMEDPNVLTKPWIIHTNLMLREGTRLQEYVCAENNLAPAFYERIEKNGVNFRRP